MQAIFTRKSAAEFRYRIRTRFRLRALEWEHAAIAVLWGIIVLSHPGLFQGSAYQAFVFAGPGQTVWGAAVMIMGIARLGALAVNGYMARPTALIRAIAAALGVAMFGILSLGILMSGTTITALAGFVVITVFGVCSIVWAIVDVGIPDRHDDHAP